LETKRTGMYSRYFTGLLKDFHAHNVDNFDFRAVGKAQSRDAKACLDTRDLHASILLQPKPEAQNLE